MGGPDLRSLIGLSMLILAGGVIGSFGLNTLARGKLGRAFIGRWRWWGLALYYVLVAGVLVAGVGWTFRSLAPGPDVGGLLESPWFFFTFGFVVGLPFTLPATTILWRQLHPSKKVIEARQKPASRQDRLNFAKDLQRQLREYGGESRTIDVELQGDKGKILFLRGDITREEGERLVTALRSDIQAMAFQRVEGKGEHGKWWVRV